MTLVSPTTAPITQRPIDNEIMPVPELCVVEASAEVVKLVLLSSVPWLALLAELLVTKPDIVDGVVELGSLAPSDCGASVCIATGMP